MKVTCPIAQYGFSNAIRAVCDNIPYSNKHVAKATGILYCFLFSDHVNSALISSVNEQHFEINASLHIILIHP